MPLSGVFITLYDSKTLSLYLDRGVYGFLMKPIYKDVSPQSRHYAALADYGCIRKGTHIFFFLKRKIVYGGEAIGSKHSGSFYINGPYSPLGKKLKPDIYWDESLREGYEKTDKPGIFKVNGKERCQPYLILFKDRLGLKGRYIPSDDLYFELGKYPYPLPSNSIQQMSFCTLTPKEVEIIISLMENSKKMVDTKSNEKIFLKDKPPIFKKEYGIQNLKDAMKENVFVNEAHLEFSLVSNPSLLPKELKPSKSTTICRQVPISPFKPAQMDRADICYYTENEIGEGTLPETIIELKLGKATQSAINQITKYLRWLKRVAPTESKKIDIHLLARSLSPKCKVPMEYEQQINLHSIMNV